MKIKTYEIIEMSNNINRHYEELSELKGSKFNYILLENIKILNKELESIQDLLKSEEYSEYQQKRVEICEKHADKDDEGNPIKTRNSENIEEYQINNKDKFNKEIEKLQKDNKKVLENYEKQIDVYNNKLNESREVEFDTISIEDVPNDISFKLMNVIQRFIS